MNINFEAVSTDMLNAMKEILSKNWSKVESTAKQFVQGKEKRLQKLSDFYFNGNITQQEFESYLGDEKKIFAAEIDALKVVSKALTQKVVNTAIDIFVKAIKAAI
jgi:hypothetical protein